MKRTEISKRFEWLELIIQFWVIFLVLFSLFCLPSKAATVFSVGDGNFNEGATWNTGSAPTNNDSVVIMPDHRVIVTATDTCKSLCIYSELDGELTRFEVNSGISFYVMDYCKIESDPIDDSELPESRLVLRGTVIIGKDLIMKTYEGTDPALAVIKMISAGGIIELHRNIIHEGDGGWIDARDIVTTTFRFSGSSNATVDVTTETEFHNIVINKTGNATVTLSNSLNNANFFGHLTIESGRLRNNGFSISGLSGKNFTIKSGSTFVLGGTSALPTVLTHVFESGSTVEFNGTNTISAPGNSQNYHHVIISGVGTKTLGANLQVNGNLSITGGTLDANTTENYGITIAGNWINSGGTFQPRTGSVTFNGSSNQAITSNGSSFYNVAITNTATAITLNGDMTVSNILTLNDGVVTTGANKLILSSTASSALGTFSSASFVNGTLRRFIGSNTSTYSFPLGNGTAAANYYRADIINNNLTGINFIDGVFTPLTNHNNNDLDVSDVWSGGGIAYTSVNNAGVWELEANAEPTGGSYTIRAYTANMNGLSDNEFAVLKRPAGSTTAADWSTGGGTLNNNDGDGRMVADGYAIRKNLSEFSEFGIGSGSSSGNGLPIELLSFTATHQNGVVLLQWVTATEINNDFFTIERSHDALNFHELDTFDGAGNSSEMLRYSATDEQPLNGISYYRLKQTDFDGAFSYSPIVTIKISSMVTLTALPNPVTNGKVKISLGNDKSVLKKISVHDITGKNVFSTTQFQDPSNTEIHFPENFSSGIYIMNIETSEGIFPQKLDVR